MPSKASNVNNRAICSDSDDQLRNGLLLHSFEKIQSRNGVYKGIGECHTIASIYNFLDDIHGRLLLTILERSQIRALGRKPHSYSHGRNVDIR